MAEQQPQVVEPDDLLLIRPGKWSFVVVFRLRGGARRFGELRRDIGGISQKILANTLRELERDGHVSRTQYAGIPPRVEYELTETGLELLRYADAWAEFVVSHKADIERARRAFDEAENARPRRFG